MSIDKILAAINQEITRLQQARVLLAGLDDALPPVKRGRGPGVAKGKSVEASVPKVSEGRRGVTEEGRMKIAAAQRARWAAKKKSAQAPRGAARKKKAEPASQAGELVSKSKVAKKRIVSKKAASSIGVKTVAASSEPSPSDL